MALQQINWLQIDTTNVPSGSEIDLGAISGSLHAVYAEHLYVSGQTLEQIIAESGTAELNLYTASLKEAIETTGSNLTVKGNLLVKGTTTAINSTTVAIGDNVIELNGTEAVNGGLLVKDPTNPNTISGSLLWDTANDYWIGGPLGTEEKIVLESELTDLSSSVSNSLNDLRTDLDASNIWQQTGSYYATTNDLQITGSVVITSGSGIFNSSLTAQTSDLYLTSGSGLYIRDNAHVEITGSVIIKGDLRVEGKTTLVQTTDSLAESLIVSGAMSIVRNQINGQVISASLAIQNLGTWADRSNVAIIDCGDGFF